MKKLNILCALFIVLTSILIITPAFAAVTSTYNYDDLYRLTRVDRSDGSAIEYRYDEAGNRTRKIVTLENGSCGTANGQSFTSAPSTNLCSAGTASTVTGSGPWNWTCQGSKGGSNSTCSALLQSGIPTGQVTAGDIAVSLIQDTPKQLLLNASDTNGNQLSYSVVATPLHGVAVVSGSNVTYTPAAGYVGSDSFTFKANNGSADSNTATVWVTVAATGAMQPPDVRLMNTFTVNGSSTVIPSESVIYGYYHMARFGGSLKADALGNLYMTYGDDKDLRYAYLDKATEQWSDSSIALRSKGASQQPLVTKTSKGIYVLSSETNWTSIYNRSCDSSLYFLDKAPGSTWVKLTDVYADRPSEGVGPSNIVDYIFADPQGNIHIQLMHEGWYSYGYAQYERIYNVTTDILGPEIGISTFPSSTPDVLKNYPFRKTDVALGSSNELLIPLFDYETKSVTMAKSLPPYGSWTQQTGFYQSAGLTGGSAVATDASGKMHATFGDSSSNLWYSYNWGPAEKITAVTNWTSFSDIIVKNGKVYILYSEQDTVNKYGDKNLNLIYKDVGGTTWSQPLKVAYETGYYLHTNGDKYYHYDRVGFAKSIEYNQEPGEVYLYYEVLDGTFSGNSYLNSHIKVMKVDSTPPPTNGVCGTANGQTSAVAPTTNLCTTGTATTVTGTGPWSWSCTGTNGGPTDNCTANKATIAIKPGDCDNSGTVTIAEVQSAINMFLKIKTVAGCVDTNGDGNVIISEVQKVINGFLGL